MKMKGSLTLIILLSIAGACISGILLVQLYYPDAAVGLISCGTGFINPCAALNQSGFSTLFGMPIAGYGLFFYMLIFISCLVAAISRGIYYRSLPALLMPLSAASLFVDIILIIILIVINTFCVFCIATYIINLMIFITLLHWHYHLKRVDGSEILLIYRELFSFKDNPDRKAALASFSILAVLLFLPISLTSKINRTKTLKPQMQTDETKSFIKYFYSIPKTDISLPQTNMALGGPEARIKIVVFTDFLCGACRKFYELEKYIINRFGSDIVVAYYSFPLDQQCNHNARKTVYINSCYTARSFIAASELGFFQDYLVYHYENFNEYLTRFKSGNVMDSLINFLKEHNADNREFSIKMNDHRIKQIQNKHIELAVNYNIKVTPTIFINGRRLEGVPHKEFIEAVILKELNK